MGQQSLGRTVADLIGRRSEGAYWDFKLRHHTDKWELVHDVLSPGDRDPRCAG